MAIAISISCNLNATLFKKIPLESLIEDSTSAAEVVLESRKSYIDKDKHVVTNYIFRVLESYNLDSKHVDQNKFLKLSLPGGVVGRLATKVESAPVFHSGVPVFVLLKEIDSKLYISNYSLGKFEIVSLKGKTIYRSSVFPNDEKLGNITKEQMIDLISKKFKSNKHVVTRGTNVSNRTPSSEYKKTKMFRRDSENVRRSPAFENGNYNGSEYEKSNKDGLYSFWVFVFFFSLCAGLVWKKLKYWNSKDSKY